MDTIYFYPMAIAKREHSMGRPQLQGAYVNSGHMVPCLCSKTRPPTGLSLVCFTTQTVFFLTTRPPIPDG